MPALFITDPNGKTYTERGIVIHENTTEIFTATANKPVTWSIIPACSCVYDEEGNWIDESPEAEKFEIDSNTGVLKFKLAPDYENPTDLRRVNNYDFYIQATDNSGNTVRQRI